MVCRGIAARWPVVAALTSVLAGVAAVSSGQTAASAPPAVQAPPQETAGSPTDPERVRRVLSHPSTGLLEASLKTEELDGLTFRVTVNQKPFNIWEFWGPSDTIVAPYVRSWYFSSWHAEYLRMVTPESGRRAALYPQGMVPVMPALAGVVGAIKEAARARAERQAKQEVDAALEQFFKEHPHARPSPPAAPDSSPGPPDSPRP